MAERFYEELRNARLTRGVELKDVARATRISIRVLEAIESGNLQILPAAYLRAFLRDYATYLGLDAARVLASYDALRSSTEPPPAAATPVTQRPAAPDIAAPAAIRPPADQRTAAPPEEASPAFEEEPQRIQPMKAPRIKRVDTNMTALVAGAIVVLTGFVLIYFFVAGDGNDKKLRTVVTQAPPPPIVPQYTPGAAQEKKAADTLKQTATPAYSSDSLTLEATTVDSVWMSVLADTAHVQRGVVQKGAHLTWRSKGKFLVTVGNSKLVVLTLNGKRLGVGDSTSRVLRNCVITAGTTALVPGTPEPTPPQKAPPAKVQKPQPAAPSAAKTGVKAPPQAAAKKPVKPQPKPAPRRKIKLKPFPDTIEKVQIK